MLRLRPTGYAQHERELKSYEGLPFALSPSPSSGQATRSEVEGRRHLFSLHFKRIPLSSMGSHPPDCLRATKLRTSEYLFGYVLWRQVPQGACQGLVRRAAATEL
jgi:hypothetical protein